MEIKPVTLTGKRARLVPMEIDHIQGLYEAARFSEIWTYLPTAQPRTPEEMVQIVQAAVANREKGIDLPFVVFDQETEAIVGSTRYIDISPANRSLEIGWTWYTPAVWRTRINTECKYLLLRHAFEEQNAVRVQLKTDGRNRRSQTAIERIGGVREGILRKSRILHDGYIRDSVYFSILDTEWPTVKARLEGWLEEAVKRTF